MTTGRSMRGLTERPAWRAVDRWGVELGEARAQRIVGALRGAGALADAHGSSTAALIRRYVGSRRRAG